jgi:hypothetical protein
MKIKQNPSAWWMMETMATREQNLILGAVLGAVGLLQVLQDDIHHVQDVADCVRILGEP